MARTKNSPRTKKAKFVHINTKPKPKKKDLTNEMSWADSTYYRGYQTRPYNPTYLYQRKGSLDIYDDMRRDEQVKAVITFKKMAAINSGWEIKMPESEEGKDEARDIEIKEFVERNLKEDLEGNFQEKLMEIFTALDYGFSVTEKIYELENGKYFLKNLKTRAPHSFRFYTTGQGNLEKGGLVQLNSTGDLSLPRNKFIIYSYQQEFDNLYGTSDLMSCYRSWFSKDIIIKFWNMYLEKFGSPLPWGKFPVGATSEEINKLKEVLDQIQSSSSIVTPENMEIEFIQSTNKSGSDYKDAINMYNMMIARSMLIPDLMGLSKDVEGGSFALGKTQFDMFLMMEQMLRTDIEELMKDQLIKQLVDLNFITDKYPVFKFKPMSEEDKKELAKLWVDAVRSGALSPSHDEKNHLRDISGFPQQDEEPVEEVPEMPVFPGKGGQAMSKKLPKKDGEEVALSQYFSLSRQPNALEKRVNFRRIDRGFNDIWQATTEELAVVLRWTFDDLKDQIIKKRVVENRDYKKLDVIQPKFMGDFKTILQGGLRRAYDLGRSEAIEEIEKIERFVRAPEDLTGGEAKTLINEKSFLITGDLKNKIKKDMRWIVVNGIEAGDSTDKIVNNVEETGIEKYIPDTDKAGKRINKAAYVEMVTRTGINDAFNQGRRKFFESPNVKPIMRAYEYSAILDDVTSDICTRLDGKVYAVNDPIWSEITPPNHPNCRSILVPVTKFDDYTLTRAKPSLVPIGNPGDKFWTT